MTLYKEQNLKIYDLLSAKSKSLNLCMMVQLVCMFAEPTVYSNVHLGNANFMSFDIVLELFTTFRLQNKICQNITDVTHIVDDVDDGEG
jgi:cysteinyl-tRNA synthetase